LFFLVVAIIFYLFYQIMVPFFVPIAWAAVFVSLFYPLYEKLLKRTHKKGFSSFVMCFLIIIIIIGPVTYLSIALVDEASNAVTKVNEMYKAGELNEMFSFDLPWLKSAKEKLSPYYDLSKINFDQIVKDAIDSVGSVVVSQTKNIITNGTKVIFFFALMIFTTYYFFRDGDKIIDRVRRLLPLTPEQIDHTMRQLRDVIQATMYGGVVVALIQGLLGGILFALVGIPSAVFWGAIMAFLSIIPFVGAFIVYIPAGIILIIGGSYIKGMIVVLAGIVVISQIDNVLRPLLISGKASIHPLLLFFTIMGGIYLFGILGLVIGPLITAVFLTLLKIFEFKLHPEENVADTITGEINE
jgi:predicted PurR-regulated permease PerM